MSQTCRKIELQGWEVISDGWIYQPLPGVGYKFLNVPNSGSPLRWAPRRHIGSLPRARRFQYFIFLFFISFHSYSKFIFMVSKCIYVLFESFWCMSYGKCVDCGVSEMPKQRDILCKFFNRGKTFFLFEPLVEILLLLKIGYGELIVF